MVSETTSAKRVPLSAMPTDSMASISNQYPLEVVKPEPQSDPAEGGKTEKSSAPPTSVLSTTSTTITTTAESSADAIPQPAAAAVAATEKPADNSTLEDRSVCSSQSQSQ